MCLAGTAETVRSHRHEGPVLSRRRFLAAGGAAAALAALPAPALARSTRHRHTQDLTHVFREGFPVYTGNPPSRRTLVTIPNDGFYAQEWTFAEHSGTHLDAPGHFIEGNRLADELPPDELVRPLAVVDISKRAAVNPDAEVRVADLVAFERRHGRIPRRALVCMNSGWDSRVGDRASYLNPDASGVFHFPGFSLEAVEWLLDRRDIQGIGVDTSSLDFGPSATFVVHTTLLGAERYGLEGVANLGRVPANRATVFVGLIPWEEGSGGPCRVIARW